MSEFEDLGLFASPPQQPPPPPPPQQQQPANQVPQVVPTSKAVKDALGERIRTQMGAASGEKRKLEAVDSLNGSDMIMSKTQKMDADHVLDHSEQQPPMNGNGAS